MSTGIVWGEVEVRGEPLGYFKVSIFAAVPKNMIIVFADFCGGDVEVGCEPLSQLDVAIETGQVYETVVVLKVEISEQFQTVQVSIDARTGGHILGARGDDAGQLLFGGYYDVHPICGYEGYGLNDLVRGQEGEGDA